MSFHAFQVTFTSGHCSRAKAIRVLKDDFHARIDANTVSLAKYDYLVVEFDHHIFEFEISPEPIRISCRFTLCHPKSVDEVFPKLIRSLMAKLDMDVDLFPPDTDTIDTYTLQEFDEFEREYLKAIAPERVIWAKMFGNEIRAASTTEVYRDIIIPQCEPVTKPRQKVA